MDEIALDNSEITYIDKGNLSYITANREGINRIKNISDADFEKELRKFPRDMQTFLRIVREREHNGKCKRK